MERRTGSVAASDGGGIVLYFQETPLILDQSQPLPASPSRTDWWRKPAYAVLFAAYFFLVSWDTLKAPFAPDDMMNIWGYWHPSPWRLLVSQVMLWHGYSRPVGGLFYVPIFLASGLNPVPYHAVLLLLLLAGAYLMYRFARVLGCAELPAAIVALIACYHGGLNNLYYNSAFVFDALCGLFYFAAFVYYAHIRSSGSLLSRGQTVAFLGLYVCALNSKEMAVTMPAVLLTYEWLYHAPPRLPWKNLVKWLRGPGSVLCWSALIDLVFIYGNRIGPNGLMKSSAYRPVFSRQRIVDFQGAYVGDIFYHLPRFGWLATLLIWLAVTYLVWRRKRPLLRFCWFYVLLTPLPIEFLEERDRACLYVCLAGWAVLAATLFTDWLAIATRVVAAEPLFRRLGPRRVRVMLAAAGMVLLALGSWRFKQTEIQPAIPRVGGPTTEVLAEFRKMNPAVRPGAEVVFLDDPWQGESFDMAFIAELWFKDRRTGVFLNRKSHLSPEEIAKADAVFTWLNEKLVRVR
jgi:hypothetical protein